VDQPLERRPMRWLREPETSGSSRSVFHREAGVLPNSGPLDRRARLPPEIRLPVITAMMTETDDEGIATAADTRPRSQSCQRQKDPATAEIFAPLSACSFFRSARAELPVVCRSRLRLHGSLTSLAKLDSLLSSFKASWSQRGTVREFILRSLVRLTPMRTASRSPRLRSMLSESPVRSSLRH